MSREGKKTTTVDTGFSPEEEALMVGCLAAGSDNPNQDAEAADDYFERMMSEVEQKDVDDEDLMEEILSGEKKKEEKRLERMVKSLQDSIFQDSNKSGVVKITRKEFKERCLEIKSLASDIGNSKALLYIGLLSYEFGKEMLKLSRVEMNVEKKDSAKEVSKLLIGNCISYLELASKIENSKELRVRDGKMLQNINTMSGSIKAQYKTNFGEFVSEVSLDSAAPSADASFAVAKRAATQDTTRDGGATPGP